jgi:hypothetical protein
MLRPSLVVRTDDLQVSLGTAMVDAMAGYVAMGLCGFWSWSAKFGTRFVLAASRARGEGTVRATYVVAHNAGAEVRANGQRASPTLAQRACACGIGISPEATLLGRAASQHARGQTEMTAVLMLARR